MMKRKTALYKAIMVIAAVGSTAMLFHRAPRIHNAELFAVTLLSVLALIAEFLAVAMPNSASGSIAFIPYLAAALVVPTWATVIGVIVVRAIADIVRRARADTALLNVALHALTAGSAIWTYSALGGQGLLTEAQHSLLGATFDSGLPAIIAVA